MVWWRIRSNLWKQISRSPSFSPFYKVKDKVENKAAFQVKDQVQNSIWNEIRSRIEDQWWLRQSE